MAIFKTCPIQIRHLQQLVSNSGAPGRGAGGLPAGVAAGVASGVAAGVSVGVSVGVGARGDAGAYASASVSASVKSAVGAPAFQAQSAGGANTPGQSPSSAQSQAQSPTQTQQGQSSASAQAGGAQGAAARGAGGPGVPAARQIVFGRAGIASGRLVRQRGRRACCSQTAAERRQSIANKSNILFTRSYGAVTPAVAYPPLGREHGR